MSNTLRKSPYCSMKSNCSLSVGQVLSYYFFFYRWHYKNFTLFKCNYKFYCRSFCQDHRPRQMVPISDRLAFYGTANALCAICMNSVEARASNETLRAPCCRNSWFHRSCIQVYVIFKDQIYYVYNLSSEK